MGGVVADGVGGEVREFVGWARNLWCRRRYGAADWFREVTVGMSMAVSMGIAIGEIVFGFVDVEGFSFGLVMFGQKEVGLGNDRTQNVYPDFPVVPQKVHERQERHDNEADVGFALCNCDEDAVEVQRGPHLGEDGPQMLIVIGIDGLFGDYVGEVEHLMAPVRYLGRPCSCHVGFGFIPVPGEILAIQDDDPIRFVKAHMDVCCGDESNNEYRQIQSKSSSEQRSRNIEENF